MNNFKNFHFPMSRENDYESNEERIKYVLDTYQKILQFVLSKGGCVAHITPDFLLNYDDYKESKNIFTNKVSSVNMNCKIFLMVINFVLM